MITPAVRQFDLCLMILSTSSRLGRVVDRVRALSDKLEEFAGNNSNDTKERQGVIFAQLDKLTSRARILQRSMVAFYLATGMFVATSVAIGVVAVIPSSPRYNYVPVIVGLLGGVLSFLWQHLVDLRGAAGAQHDSRGNGFRLAPGYSRCSGRSGRTTQTAFCTFSQSQ